MTWRMGAEEGACMVVLSSTPLTTIAHHITAAASSPVSLLVSCAYQTANHHLDGVSILNLAINALKEVMEAYVPPSAYFTNPNL